MLTIVDYKTNQSPPNRVEDIPEIYLKQLEGYATALKSIYPNHKVKKVLLWTEGPKIQVVGQD
jgi:ATP-dependent helicase/nuclease subunit A